MANYTYAQVARGVIAGGNVSFYSDVKDNSVLVSPIGLQVGYQWSYLFAESWSLGAAGMVSQIASVDGATKDILLSKSSKLETYLAIPLSINYSLKSFYLGAGYEYAYNISQNTLLNENNHSAIFQLGYKLKFMDILLKYNLGLNSEKYNTNLYAGEAKNEISLPKINSLQLSIIVPICK